MQIQQHCQLVIVGDGPDKARLERMAQSLRLKIHFAGYQSGEELSRYFIAADLFVLPGRGG